MLLDLHCHVLPEGYSALEDTYGVPPGAPPPPPALSHPDVCWGRLGEDGLTIASPPPTLFRYELAGAAARRYAAALNDGMAAGAGGRRGAAILGWLPLQSAEAAVSEARRLARESLVLGVVAGTSINGSSLSNPRLDPVWTTLAEEELALFIHPNVDPLTDALPGLRPQVLGFPVATTEALLELLVSDSGIWDAGVRLCAAHGGGFIVPALGRAVHAGAWDGGEALEPRLARLWVDGVLFDDSWLTFLHGSLHERHVLPGTDWPFPLSVSSEGLKRQVSLLEPDPLAAVSEWCPRITSVS